MNLNPAFIKNIQATYGQQGDAWLANLDSHIEKLASLWQFEFIKPIPDLSYNFVATVKLADKTAIIKTAPPAAKLAKEAEWLQSFTSDVPTIYQVDKENNAYLMEQLEPGTSLKHLVKQGRDDEATKIIAKVIMDLQSSLNSNRHQNYSHLSSHADSFHVLKEYVDKAILTRGMALFKLLCQNQSNDTLLHGDLHHDNILKKGMGWGVIDPHGYIGEACAEVGPMLYNPLDSFPDKLSLKDTINNRLRILANNLPFALGRIRAWGFCLALRSVAWDVEGFGEPNQHTLDVAQVLFESLE
jgi:streptomycin 6-kinase